MDSKGKEYNYSKVLDLRKERDTKELHRISDIKSYYETQITMEESCFKAFKEQYERLKKNLDDTEIPAEIKEILLESCLDRWAFWLDENVSGEKSKRTFKSSLDKFISCLKSLDTGYRKKNSSCLGISTLKIEYDSTSWLAWVAENPSKMIKLGKCLAQENEHKNAYENSIKLFNEVIEKEPDFSEAAHYYKAFTLTKKINWEQKPLKGENKETYKQFKNELRQSAGLLNEHSKFAINAAGIISKIKKNNRKSIIQIDAYEQQQKNMANLYYMFSQSIDDIFGRIVSPKSFVNYDIDEEKAEVLFKDLLENGILKKPKVKRKFSEEKLKAICSGYGILVETLKSFLSKHAGKDIDEKGFQKALKGDVKLPSREGFWRNLIQNKVLSEEVKYVIVDSKKLKELDSSLLKKLKGQVLEQHKEQVLLNVEWIATQKKSNDSIFIKSDFIKVVGNDKYKILKEQGTLSFNKKARLNLNEIESIVLLDYDSININDFTNKANITEIEAEKILIELVNRGILENNPKNGFYKLKIKFNEIEQVQLPSCPVYENAVKGLLYACFTYRIALQKIEKQIELENFPIRLQLMTKPHQRLVLDLLEQNIIKPTTVATKNENLEGRLKNIYNQKTTKDSLNITKEDTFNFIIRTLDRSKSSLKSLKVPDSPIGKK